MKPKELLKFYIEKELVKISEPLGFKYAKSGPKFPRRTGAFTLSFTFHISKYSSEKECIFWTEWGVSSKDYKKWYKKTWDTNLMNDVIVGSSDWNIPGWLESDYDHVVLYNNESDRQEFKKFISNVLNVGIPYYEQIVDWNTAASLALQAPLLFYEEVRDFYMM
ncbi:hypothetical protein [Priestia flexa]|uniref:hypothetical protein n=1 Tax=Priestia flexa TaxID=86664 RepID=UPI0024913247|nr:hypothetical protein [Priestia flexa]